MLHYEDATLKDLYFLDPQWLCDMLAHVVTIREINPFAPNGQFVHSFFGLKHPLLLLNQLCKRRDYEIRGFTASLPLVH